MSTQSVPHITSQEYLALERQAEVKSEYYAGEMFLMSGASRAHNLIVANLIREIGNQLKGRTCRVYPSDMRVKVDSTGLYTYPDVIVVCGEEQFDDEHEDTLLNPTVVIDVLSDSTEAYDRGKKFEHYRRLESLAEYVLVAQTNRHLEHYTRKSADEWLLTEASLPDSEIELPSCGCVVSLAEVYDKVTFPTPAKDDDSAATGAERHDPT